MTIESLSAAVSSADREALIALLIACVDGGASLGYLAPMPRPDAEAYWNKVIGELTVGFRVLIVAREPADQSIVGSAQLSIESRPNGRHRAEVQKVIVLPTARRQGIARQLMSAIERTARGRGVSLLHLDTSDGPSGARSFYDALDYVHVGGIPDWALDPDGTPADNAIYYKRLAPSE